MQQQFHRRTSQFVLLAACVACVAACDPSPTSPDEGFRFKAPPTAAVCSSLFGVFAAPTIVVFRDGQAGVPTTFTGDPALLVTFTQGRFTSNVLGGGLPPVTNVGSFSISGGFVIFGERPLMPRLNTASQQFSCQATAAGVILVNDQAMFDFGSGTFEHARMRIQLVRR